MDPILGAPVAAEIRSVEETKPARVSPFRYNRARQEIKAAGLLLAKVKREARGKILLSREPMSGQDEYDTAKAKELQGQHNSPDCTDEQTTLLRTELRKMRPGLRRIKRTGIYAPVSSGAVLLLPSMKRTLRAMQWAWAIARAIEAGPDALEAEHSNPAVQYVRLGNGNYARLKRPDNGYIDIADGGSPAADLAEFQEFAIEDIFNEDGTDADVSLGEIEVFLERWRIAPRD